MDSLSKTVFCLLQGSWLPTLRNLVSQINGTFSRNFQEMAVAGEVSLGKTTFLIVGFIASSECYIYINDMICTILMVDEHDMDFRAYGIVIKVKFR